MVLITERREEEREHDPSDDAALEYVTNLAVHCSARNDAKPQNIMAKHEAPPKSSCSVPVWSDSRSLTITLMEERSSELQEEIEHLGRHDMTPCQLFDLFCNSLLLVTCLSSRCSLHGSENESLQMQVESLKAALEARALLSHLLAQPVFSCLTLQP